LENRIFWCRKPISLNATFAFSIGTTPDRHQCQQRGKRHEQTNRSPFSIWSLHIFLQRGREGGNGKTVEAPANAFLFTFVCPSNPGLLFGSAFDYRLFLRLTQPSNYPTSGFLQPSTAIQSDVPPLSVLKTWNFRRNFAPLMSLTPWYSDQFKSYIGHLGYHAVWELSY